MHGFLFIYLFIWLHWVLVAVCRLSSCGACVLDLAHGLSCPVACGILVPRSVIEPASPALEGGFLTTGPPGKSQMYGFNGLFVNFQFCSTDQKSILLPVAHSLDYYTL